MKFLPVSQPLDNIPVSMLIPISCWNKWGTGSREVERVFNLAEAEGLTGMGITNYIEEHIDLANVLRTSSREWDGDMSFAD